ncbi:MAG: VWA domain-containing protein [Myxococcales bacterium]
MQRALHEFVAAVRRAGGTVSSAEVLDAAQALSLLGLESREDVRDALLCTLGKTESDRARVRASFERYFSASGATHADLFERLSTAGFSASELSSLRVVLEAQAKLSPAGEVLATLVQGEPAIDHLIERAARRVQLGPARDPQRAGFVTMRLLEAARVPRAETDLAGIRGALRGALGARGEALADALAEELRVLKRRARQRVDRAFAGEPLERLEERPFGELTPTEVAAVQQAVRELAQRLLGRAAVRARHLRRGRIDARRTLRKALHTAGTPIELAFRRRSPKRPKLVMLCDVSDSMHESARFMLLFVHAVQRLFADARSFVFVSDVADASAVFRAASAERAIELAYRGAIVSVADNSHYARAFSQLLDEHPGALDRRTTLLILGDARTNHLDPGLASFRALSTRVQRVLWFTPDEPADYQHGDSALPLYAPEIDQVFSVRDLRGLERAARALVRF